VSARAIRRLDDAGGIAQFEGVALREIAAECATVAHETRIEELREQILGGGSLGAQVDNVVELHGYSRRVAT
jgi:hypothetical protein